MALGIVDVAIGILGLGCLGLAVSTMRKGWQLAIARPVDAETEPGDIARAFGTVAPAGEELVAPLSETSCSAYVLAQEQYYWSRGPLLTEQWHTGRTVGEIRPFALETSAGRVLVDIEHRSVDNLHSKVSFGTEPPGGRFAETRLDVDEQSQKFAAGESPPSSIQDVFIGRLPEPTNPHRYLEWRIESGDLLTVVGEVITCDDSTFPNNLAIGDPGSTFIISEQTHRRTLLAFARRTALFVGFGAPMLGLLAYRLWETLA